MHLRIEASPLAGFSCLLRSCSVAATPKVAISERARRPRRLHQTTSSPGCMMIPASGVVSRLAQRLLECIFSLSHIYLRYSQFCETLRTVIMVGFSYDTRMMLFCKPTPRCRTTCLSRKQGQCVHIWKDRQEGLGEVEHL